MATVLDELERLCADYKSCQTRDDASESEVVMARLDLEMAMMDALPSLLAAARALIPFSEEDECGIGIIIDEEDEHCARCDECRRVLAARAALAPLLKEVGR